MNILITGGAGFIGSNFIPFFLEKYSDYKIFNLDALTYAASLDNLKEIEGHQRYQFIKGNICDRDLLEKLFRDKDIKGVINFAAETHVDHSISDPEIFVQSNVVGTMTLLDVAFKHWMERPFKIKSGYEESRFHHISTDEVYGSLGKTGLFTEETSYAPNSPYAASKASSEMFLRSYFNTYGMNLVITNCSNNYGPFQHPEKLIPTIITNALNGLKIPIYGDGENVRDWLYVMDHCRGIDVAYHKGCSGENYNIGGKNERTNNQIVSIICRLLDKLNPKTVGTYLDLITHVADRAGHDRRYAIDATKIETDLNWQSQEAFEQGIMKTVKWYLRDFQRETRR